MKTKAARPRFEPDDLLDDEDLGRYLGVTAQHVRCNRMKNRTWDGPPYIEISPKVKRHLFSDVLLWVKERRKNPAEQIAEVS